MQKLPRHLQKYVVDQDYNKYTPIDQACWRYILRQLRAYLSVHAHECYLEGLQKTGIEISRIPKISEISKKLEAFGWRALPVSGFIPPATFMEMQSLGILPIASDMRSLSHLMYTPAPDIVHEAAGHAPILIHPEFAQYLRNYAQVAKRAILSKEDLNLYEAIRILSDVKENPSSTEADIEKAQKQLEIAIQSITHVSEASELSRMNWWTAEYGLIGDIRNPKIFGAGLLSSVGESKWCLSDKVKKIPLSIECIRTSYDITEPQPQLFVARDFKHLNEVLDEMASQMAFRVGGYKSALKALQAGTVNTVELDTGLQISGKLSRIESRDSTNIDFLKFDGPTQLSYKDEELSGHGISHHNHGYSSPLGLAKNISLEDFSAPASTPLEIEFESGITLRGRLDGLLRKNNRNILLSFSNCTLKLNDEVLFKPEWGSFDLAVGRQVTSVFGGPADRSKFGETEDFVAARVPNPIYSQEQKQIFSAYQKIRDIREANLSNQNLESILPAIINELRSAIKNEWLLWLEIYELLHLKNLLPQLQTEIRMHLEDLAKNPDFKMMIADGLKISQVPD